MSLRTSIFIDLAGNLQARASQFLGSMQRFGQGSTSSVQVLNRTLEATGRGLDKLGNRYTALLSGAAGIGTVKKVGDLSQRLTYLGINAEVNRARIDKLYKSIMDVAQMKDVRVDPGEILSGVEMIVQKTGDLALAEGNIRNIGLAIRATKADGKDVGDLIANFSEKFGLNKPQEITEALDLLIKQGHAGAFELKDMVTQGNRVTAAYGAMGRTGMRAVRELGAVMQVYRKSTGVPEEVATAFKNTFQDLLEPSKRKYLEALKINIWDPEKLKEGKKQVRNVVDIIGEIMKKTKGDPEKLSRIFGMQTLDGLKQFMSEYQKTGENAADKFMNIEADGTSLIRDATEAAQELDAAIQNINNSWQRFTNSNLAMPVKKTADFINSIDPKKFNTGLTIASYGAGILGGAVLARKGWNVYQWGRDLFKGKGKTGLPGSGLPEIPGMGKAVPVYVVNMPGSMPNVSLPSTLPGTGGGKIPGMLKKIPWGSLARLGLRSLPVVGTAVAAYEIGGMITDKVSGGKYHSMLDLLDLLKNRDAAKQQPQKTEIGGKIAIEVQDKRIAVREVRSSTAGLDLDVSTDLGLLVMP